MFSPTAGNMPGTKIAERLRREQIVTAAYDLALRGGVRAATVRSVARRSGISVGLVIFHFGTLVRRCCRAHRVATTSGRQRRRSQWPLDPHDARRTRAPCVRAVARIRRCPDSVCRGRCAHTASRGRPTFRTTSWSSPCTAATRPSSIPLSGRWHVDRVSRNRIRCGCSACPVRAFGAGFDDWRERRDRSRLTERRAGPTLSARRVSRT